MRQRRASTSKQAREYRQRGHDSALAFAQSIGMPADYANDRRAKKDVIDPSGDAHSVKSGQQKWQIFLYSRSRFETDDGFQALNGVGSLLIHCIDAFPPRFEDYRGNENAAKERLRTPMRELKDRFQRKALLRAFLRKAIFNGGEVDYLTVVHDDRFHIFLNDDVISAMGEHFTVANSTSASGNPPEQKVLFRYNNRNVGELEMRNESPQHYQEVRFNMNKRPAVELLLDNARQHDNFADNVIVYDSAIRRFGNWRRG